MSFRFKDKYRISSTRLQHWDYGWDGLYFITINTYQRTHHFGEIDNNKMHLSKAGELANEFWQEIPERFHYAKLDVFTVMPNHFHGIVEIDKMGMGSFSSSSSACDSKDAITSTPLSTSNRVFTTPRINSEDIGGATGIKNPMLHQNLSRIIRWYKGRISFEARKEDPMFEWQSRFHDHLIRDMGELNRIRRYIENNVKNWKGDEYLQL